MQLITRMTDLFDDYARFHEIELENRDVDPVYPVLREIGNICDWTPEERVRSVFLHVAYYDLGSALCAMEAVSQMGWSFQENIARLTCGTERRRHRMGNNLIEHLSDLHLLASQNDGLLTWLTDNLGSDQLANWQRVTEKLMNVNGNGRWASFKTCEMLAEVCGLPLAAPDMGHANSSGPRQGLALLFEDEPPRGNGGVALLQLNAMSELLVRELRGRGLEARLETAETTLCDFHSLVRGRYYPGLDIDVMQEQLNKAPVSGEMMERAFLARERTLPGAYLGEREGRNGPDPVRKRAYKETGVILVRR